MGPKNWERKRKDTPEKAEEPENKLPTSAGMLRLKTKKKIFGENTKVIKERTSETKMLINKASSTQRSKIKDFFG